jgi:hypothetical protein
MVKRKAAFPVEDFGYDRLAAEDAEQILLMHRTLFHEVSKHFHAAHARDRDRSLLVHTN